MPQIRAVESLPIGELMAVQPTNSNTVIWMSQNGRYVLKGRLYDVWAGRFLDTIQDVEDTKNKMNLQRLNVVVNQLDPITIGHGPKQVVIFSDPMCPACGRLLRQAARLGDRYTFKVLMLPLLSRQSGVRVRALACAMDRPAVTRALLAGQPYAAAPQHKTCDLEAVKRRMVVAQLFGIREVPVIIAPDYRKRDGVPADLSAWLGAKS